MCCTTRVAPLDKLVAETLLTIGQFERRGGEWARTVQEDDGTLVTVRVQMAEADVLVLEGSPSLTGVLRLTLSPGIQSMEHHRRISGGLYFEMACKYAEKVGGVILQSSNVGPCIANSAHTKLLAVYPEQPMDWTAVCLGFQKVLLGE